MQECVTEIDESKGNELLIVCSITYRFVDYQWVYAHLLRPEYTPTVQSSDAASYHAVVSFPETALVTSLQQLKVFIVSLAGS